MDACTIVKETGCSGGEDWRKNERGRVTEEWKLNGGGSAGSRKKKHFWRRGQRRRPYLSKETGVRGNAEVFARRVVRGVAVIGAECCESAVGLEACGRNCRKLGMWRKRFWC